MTQALIESYTHCPICGSPDFRLDQNTRKCGNCGFTDFNNPVVAVAVWIVDASNNLLLIERAKDPGKGKFAPPGGFVDAGENLESAARREILEETGITIDTLAYVHSAPNDYTYAGRTRPVCDVFFVARVKEISVTPEQQEVSSWRLVLYDCVDPQQLAFESMRTAHGALLDYLAKSN